MDREQRIATRGELEAALVEVRGTCVCDGMRRAARTITNRYEQALAPSQVRATQFPILLALGAAGPVPLTPLADGLDLDRTTLTRNLRVLQERGLVRSESADHDARVRLVRLTDEGLRALSGALELWRAQHQALVDEFGRARLAATLHELSDLTRGAG